MRGFLVALLCFLPILFVFVVDSQANLPAENELRDDTPKKRQPFPWYSDSDEVETSPIPSGTDTPVRFLTLGRMFAVVFVLIFSLVIVYLLGTLLKRNMFRAQSVLGAQGSFRVLGHLYLNPKQVLYLVEVADRVLVVSATENSINTLSEITDAEIVKSLRTEFSAHDFQRANFIQYLKRTVGKTN
ncbi:hypothetical protein CMK22_08085 [Candidatus Poribacteria bacterium]|nr:hypothetical protein [Candidatus Poribacteria bacterium]